MGHPVLGYQVTLKEMGQIAKHYIYIDNPYNFSTHMHCIYTCNFKGSKSKVVMRWFNEITNFKIIF